MAIEIISTLKPKNNGTFPIAEAKDIDVNGKRLDTKLAELEENAGSGGGGTGGGIIDVAELPTEGIDEQSIYRRVIAGKISVVIVTADMSQIVRDDGETVRIYVVDTIPSTIPESTEECFVIYIEKAAGVSYINFGGQTVTLGQMMLGADGYDKGWTTDTINLTDMGVYAYDPGETHTYQAYKNQKWVEIGNNDTTRCLIHGHDRAGMVAWVLTDNDMEQLRTNFRNTYIVVETDYGEDVYYPVRNNKIDGYWLYSTQLISNNLDTINDSVGGTDGDTGGVVRCLKITQDGEVSWTTQYCSPT